MNPIQIRGASAVIIEIEANAYTRRQEAVDAAQFCRRVVDAGSQQTAVDALKEVNALLGVVEKGRKEVKAPILDLGRKIDTTAEEFSVPLATEQKRLQGLLSAYEIEQRRIAAEAEAKRQAELRRQQEEERKRQEEADRLARIEREKQEAAIRAAREATDAESRAKAKAEADAAAARAAELAAQREKEAAEARLKQAELLRAPAPTPTRAVGSSVRTLWTFDVTDIAALYAARPELVELTPKRAAILALIRDGTREIPGLVIRKEVTVNAR